MTFDASNETLFLLLVLLGGGIAFLLLLRFARTGVRAYARSKIEQFVHVAVEIDEEMRQEIAARYDLIPGENILGQLRRTFLRAPEERLIVTDMRVIQDRNKKRESVRLWDIESRTDPQGRDGSYYFELNFKKRGYPRYGITFRIDGREDGEKFRSVVADAYGNRHARKQDGGALPDDPPVGGRRPSMLWLIPAIAFFAGAAMALLSWSEFSSARDRIETFVKAEGTVTGYEAEYDADEGEDVYFPKVVFQTEDGERIQFTSSLGGWNSYDIGETVPVLHDPAHPRIATIDSFLHHYVTTLMSGILGLACLGISVLLAHVVRNEG